jgi:hypothetical protein
MRYREDPSAEFRFVHTVVFFDAQRA